MFLNQSQYSELWLKAIHTSNMHDQIPNTTWNSLPLDHKKTNVKKMIINSSERKSRPQCTEKTHLDQKETFCQVHHHVFSPYYYGNILI